MITKRFNLSDALIAQISRTLQVAILSGTDVVDHLRRLEVTPDADGKLVMTPEYVVLFEGEIEAMLTQVEKNLAGETTTDEN